MMVEPTVFVVPPHASLVCPLHLGVFEDPVTAPCGCTYCSSCIETELKSMSSCPANKSHYTLLTPNLLRPNSILKERVNDLLIHCKYGVRHDEKDGWVPSPSPDACKLWIRFGSRSEHESKCAHKIFVEDEFYIVDGGEDDLLDFTPEDDDSLLEFIPDTESDGSTSESVNRSVTRSASVSPVSPSPIIACSNREDGCEYTSAVAEDMRAHIVVCEREYLQKQIDVLVCELQEKKEEINRLRLIIEERQNLPENLPEICEINNNSDDSINANGDNNNSGDSINANGDNNNNNGEVINIPQEVLIFKALKKLLNKLEDDSQRALEDAAVALKKTRIAFKKSASQAISSIKHAFEEASDEIVSKFNHFINSFDKPNRQPEEEQDIDLKKAMEESEVAYNEESTVRNNEEEELKNALHLSIIDSQTESNTNNSEISSQ